MNRSDTRVPYPTRAELNEAVALDREIIACSAVPCGPLKAMNIAFRNGDISTVYIGEVGALCLAKALTALFPSIESAPASPVRLDSEGRLIAGHMSSRRLQP